MEMLTLEIINTFASVYIFSFQIDIPWPATSRKRTTASMIPMATFAANTMTYGWEKLNAKQFFPVKVGKNFPLFRFRFAGWFSGGSLQQGAEAAS